MTEDKNPSPRPSWLSMPCPEWCTSAHQEDDHPEDRIHHDDGQSFAVVIGVRDPDTLLTSGLADEIVIRRYQAIADSRAWVSIHRAESDLGALILSEDAAEELGRRLLSR